MSDYLKLNIRDLVKGGVVAALTVLFTGIAAILDNGAFPTVDQWKSIGWMALTSFGSYLVKNLFTNNEDEFMKPDVKA